MVHLYARRSTAKADKFNLCKQRCCNSFGLVAHSKTFFILYPGLVALPGTVGVEREAAENQLTWCILPLRSSDTPRLFLRVSGLFSLTCKESLTAEAF